MASFSVEYYELHIWFFELTFANTLNKESTNKLFITPSIPNLFINEFFSIICSSGLFINALNAIVNSSISFVLTVFR